jgi:mono/diheme cytochrome c family protein
MFTVPTGYNFHDPVCKGVDFICWPTVGASSIEYYGTAAFRGHGGGIPGWDKVLLVTTLKRGSLYVLPLTPDGKKAAGHFSRYFQSENRYRDTAVSPDGKTIYIATDQTGLAEALNGGTTQRMQDPGAILAFTYEGEGNGSAVTEAARPANRPAVAANAGGAAVQGAMPTFTAAQVQAGKTAYDANCAVCHGNTMTNGTFAPPLAGEYFKTTWAGKTVGEFYTHSKTMPPASPASLSDDVYASIVAYVLETNGYKAGATALPVGSAGLAAMRIR